MTTDQFTFTLMTRVRHRHIRRGPKMTPFWYRNRVLLDYICNFLLTYYFH